MKDEGGGEKPREGRIRKSNERKRQRGLQPKPFVYPLLQRLLNGDWATVGGVAEEIRKGEEIIREVVAMLRNLREREDPEHINSRGCQTRFGSHTGSQSEDGRTKGSRSKQRCNARSRNDNRSIQDVGRGEHNTEVEERAYHRGGIRILDISGNQGANHFGEDTQRMISLR